MAFCSPQQQCQQEEDSLLIDAAEYVCGVQSDEIFVRTNRDLGLLLRDPTVSKSAGSSTLHGSRPFVMELLGVGGEDAVSAERHLVIQRRNAKIEHARALRRQIKARRAALREEAQWTHEAIEKTAASARAGVCVGATRQPSCRPRQAVAWPEYVVQFEKLAQLLSQHVAADVLRLYALSDAESDFIREWVAKEEAQCAALRQQTKLLYRFSLFAMQLENETSGQVRMRRLPLDDPQRRRCVKAASENVKRDVLGVQSVEVMEVYKIENRVLLDVFQRHAAVLPPSLGAKIKGLFCCVPSESVERCVVFGMHSDPSIFEGSGDAGGARMFSQSGARSLESDDSDAPGTARTLRARSRAIESPPLEFPRRFSRYSTLEELRASMSETSGAIEGSFAVEGASTSREESVRYLMLCRVAIGKMERVSTCESDALPPNFADYDTLVGTLLFPDEEEYLVRYPQAVVPEFLLQYRLVAPLKSQPPMAAAKRIVSVDLSAPAADLASNSFRELALDPSPLTQIVSAFPLHLRDDPIDNVFSESSVSSSPRQLRQRKREDEHSATVSADIILANCARQKTRLREDLDKLHSLFWVASRDAWARALNDQPCLNKTNASASTATLLADMVSAGSAMGIGTGRRIRP